VLTNGVIALTTQVELTSRSGGNVAVPVGYQEYINKSGVALNILSVTPPETYCVSDKPASECQSGLLLDTDAICATSFTCTPPVVIQAVDDAIAVANGSSAATNVLDNDLGAPPLNAVGFGEIIPIIYNYPADGATVGSFPAPGGGTLDVTLADAGGLSVTANGTTGSGSVTIYYMLQAGDGSRDPGAVTMSFGDFPTAVDDTLATLGSGNEFTTDVGVTLNVGAGTGLLNNDTLGSPSAALALWGAGNASMAVDRGPGSSRPFAGGTLTVYADGSFDLVNPTTPGTFSFDYILQNDIGTSQATVEIYVLDPPIAQDDALFASGSQTNNYSAPGLLADNGAGADYLGTPAATIVSFGGGSFGGTAASNPAGSTVAIPVQGGSLTVNADGSVVVDSPLQGVFTFDYLISNGAGSSIATVTVTVGPSPPI